MTIQLKSTIARPSTDVPWTNKGNNLPYWYLDNQYFLDTWYQKGRLFSATVTYSDDNLIITGIMEFSDWEALDDFSSDITLITECKAPRDLYYDAVGIKILNMEAFEV
jgi:hypothetical protein